MIRLDLPSAVIDALEPLPMEIVRCDPQGRV
jgi:hypothetical protein